MTARGIAKIGLTIVWLNWMAYMFGVFLLGGDALNGHSANGHYFLDDKGHLTEVTRAVFVYSEWHSIASIITTPIGVGCAWYLLTTQPKDTLLFRLFGPRLFVSSPPRVRVGAVLILLMMEAVFVMASVQLMQGR